MSVDRPDNTTDTPPSLSCQQPACYRILCCVANENQFITAWTNCIGGAGGGRGCNRPCQDARKYIIDKKCANFFLFFCPDRCSGSLQRLVSLLRQNSWLLLANCTYILATFPSYRRDRCCANPPA